MRSGILVVLLASIACSQELRFVCPVPAPTDFTQSNLVYKQAGQTGLSLDFSSPTHSARSKPLPVFVIFNGFGGGFMQTSAQSQGWAKAATAHGFAAITAETTADHVAEDFDSLAFYLRQKMYQYQGSPPFFLLDRGVPGFQRNPGHSPILM